jgi:trimeric autotransporter adhesin
MGNDAQAMGDGTSNTAVGAGTRANFSNSAAFGAGATATRADQQVFGTATNTYTMAGIASAASAAAQTGPRQLVTSDANGNLATASLASLGLAGVADVSAINARLDDLAGRSSKAYAGVAMAGTPTVLPHERFVTTFNWGTFQGSNAFAVSGAVRLDERVQLNGGVAFSPDQNLAAGRAGVRIGW